MFCLSEVSIELSCLRHRVPEALKRLPWQWGVYLCYVATHETFKFSHDDILRREASRYSTEFIIRTGLAPLSTTCTLPLPKITLGTYCYYCYYDYDYDYYIPSTFLSTTCSRFRERHHQSSSISTSNCFRSARAPQPAITRADDVWVVA